MLMLDNPWACGLGQGKGCCAFLMMSTDFCCGRTDPGLKYAVRARLAEGTMHAQYDPGETPFPGCQPGERRPSASSAIRGDVRT